MQVKSGLVSGQLTVVGKIYGDLEGSATHLQSVSGNKIRFDESSDGNDIITYNSTNHTFGKIPKNNFIGSFLTEESLANTLNINHIPFVVGTQTISTNAFTGTVSSFSELRDGQTIRYWLPQAGTSTSATLNLTFSDGTTTGAKNVYWKGANRLTTHFPAGSLILLTYQSAAKIGTSTYEGWWPTSDYNSDDNYNLRYYQNIQAGSNAITRYNVIVADSNAKYFHLNSGNAFDITYPIMYAGSNISANSTSNSNYIVYRFTIATTQSMTMTTYQPVYIKGTLNGRMFTPVSTTPLTQTIPTTEDNYQYMLLGIAYSSTYLYLPVEHPIFEYRDGSFHQVELSLMKGATSSASGKSGLVPVPSVGDQGKFLRGDGTWATAYSLPTASSTVSGGVKIGSNISISNGTISVVNASTSTKGVVQLASEIDTSTAMAATPNAVKTYVDNAASKVTFRTHTSATDHTDATVSDLIINKVPSQTIYNSLTKNENELYMIEGVAEEVVNYTISNWSAASSTYGNHPYKTIAYSSLGLTNTNANSIISIVPIVESGSGKIASNITNAVKFNEAGIYCCEQTDTQITLVSLNDSTEAISLTIISREGA